MVMGAGTIIVAAAATHGRAVPLGGVGVIVIVIVIIAVIVIARRNS
jgi:hypothetical protein